MVKLCPIGASQSEESMIKLGQTKPKIQTLSPKWNKTFKKTMLKKDLTEFACFEVAIWDYDEDNGTFGTLECNGIVC